MRHVGAAASDIVGDDSRETARAGWIEAEEPNRLADRVVLQAGSELLAQLDRDSPPHTQLDRLIARLEVAIDQDTVDRVPARPPGRP